MSSVTVTRQDARQVIAEQARNLALLLDVLDDTLDVSPPSSHRHDEIALIERLNALARAPENTPAARKLLHEAFTLARIRGQRTVRHVRGSLLQRFISLLQRLTSLRPQPRQSITAAGDTPINADTLADTLAEFSRTFLRELDETRRHLDRYLDRYLDDPDIPAGTPAAATPATLATRRPIGAGTATATATLPVPKAASAAVPKRQKPTRAPTRNKSRPSVAKQSH